MVLVNEMSIDENSGICLKKNRVYYTYTSNLLLGTEELSYIDEDYITGEYIQLYVNTNTNYYINIDDPAECLNLTGSSINDFFISYANDLVTTGYTSNYYTSAVTEDRIIYENSSNTYYKILHTNSTGCTLDYTSKLAVLNHVSMDLWNSGDTTTGTTYYYMELNDCGVETGREYVIVKELNSLLTTYNGIDYIQKPQEIEYLPTVETISVTLAPHEYNSVTFSGITTDAGGPDTNVLDSGFCYGIFTNPDFQDFQLSVTSGVTGFSSYVENLLPDFNYYVRAYATNNYGTSFGNELEFRIVTPNFIDFYIKNSYLSNTIPLYLSGVEGNESQIIGFGWNVSGETIGILDVWSSKLNTETEDQTYIPNELMKTPYLNDNGDYEVIFLKTPDAFTGDTKISHVRLYGDIVKILFFTNSSSYTGYASPTITVTTGTTMITNTLRINSDKLSVLSAAGNLNGNGWYDRYETLYSGYNDITGITITKANSTGLTELHLAGNNNLVNNIDLKNTINFEKIFIGKTAISNIYNLPSSLLEIHAVECTGLETTDFSGLNNLKIFKGDNSFEVNNTNDVQIISAIKFNGCDSLSELSVKNIKKSTNQDILLELNGCDSLSVLDVRGTITSPTNLNSLFSALPVRSITGDVGYGYIDYSTDYPTKLLTTTYTDKNWIYDSTSTYDGVLFENFDINSLLNNGYGINNIFIIKENGIYDINFPTIEYNDEDLIKVSQKYTITLSTGTVSDKLVLPYAITLTQGDILPVYIGNTTVLRSRVYIAESGTKNTFSLDLNYGESDITVGDTLEVDKYYWKKIN